MKKVEYIAKYGEEAWEKKLEQDRQYRKAHKEEISLRQKQYCETHREQLREYNKQYNQTHKERFAKYRNSHSTERKEYNRQYYQTHKEERAEYDKQYREAHKDSIKCYRQNNILMRNRHNKKYRDTHREQLREYNKQYSQTQNGRAANLCRTYRRNDRQENRGKCTLTPEWIISNIFNAQCAYCSDDDWTHLGADRINNNLPHTPENCIPACFICNCERNDKYTVEEFKEYRSLHPRELGCTSEVNWEITELPSGLKVIKKK